MSILMKAVVEFSFY